MDATKVMINRKNDIISKKHKIIKAKDQEIEKLKGENKKLLNHKENLRPDKNTNSDLFDLFLHADTTDITNETKAMFPTYDKKQLLQPIKMN